MNNEEVEKLRLKIERWSDRANRMRDPYYPACELMDASRLCGKLLDVVVSLQSHLGKELSFMNSEQHQ